MTCRHHGPNLGETTPCCLHEAERGGSVVLTIAQLHELIAREVDDINTAYSDGDSEFLTEYARQLRACPDAASCVLAKRIAKLKRGAE